MNKLGSLKLLNQAWKLLIELQTYKFYDKLRDLENINFYKLVLQNKLSKASTSSNFEVPEFIKPCIKFEVLASFKNISDIKFTLFAKVLVIKFSPS